jgi:hypothetical protein
MPQKQFTKNLAQTRIMNLFRECSFFYWTMNTYHSQCQVKIKSLQII